jgi:hypothetical protein
VKAIDKINSVFSRLTDQLQQLAPPRGRIRLTPEFAVIGIVFGRVKIGIHAACGTKFKDGFAVRHAPRRAKKSFDEAAALESLNFHQ